MQNRDLRNMQWSHKFRFIKRSKELGLKTHHRIFNKRLLGLYQRDKLLLGRNKGKYARAIKNEKLNKYQSRLMERYFSNPHKYLTLDCDRLTATFDITQNDVDKLLNGIVTFPHESYKEVLSIKKVSVGSINNMKKYKNENGELDNKRPFYTHCYRIEAFNNLRKFFIIHIADGTHPKSTKQGFRIDFIPDRFSGLEIRMLFNHLKSLLTTKRYGQLVKNANVTRIDLGMNFYGLMSSFMVVYNHANRNRSVDKYSSKTWPKRRYITETAYFGSKRCSSHFILYEKLLKELKDDADHLQFANVRELLPKLIVTTRLERRHYPYREKCGACSAERKKIKRLKPEECKRHKRCEVCDNCIKCGPRYKKLTLAELSDFEDRFSALRFIDPRVTALLNDTRFGKLLLNKNHHNVKRLLVDRKPHAIRNGTYQLDKGWLEEAKQKLLQRLSDFILHPNKCHDADGALKEDKVTARRIREHAKHVNELPKNEHYSALKLHNRDSDYPAQEEAVKSSTSRNKIVISGAGSGKTHTIIERTKHLVKQGIAKQDIRVLAYNVDAAKQLQQSDACGQISTFHAWCKNALEHFYPCYKSKKLLVYRDELKVADEKREANELSNKEYCNVLNKVGVPTNHRKRFLTLYSYRVNTGEKFDEIINSRNVNEFSSHQLERICVAYEAEKERRNYWDFDDMFATMLRQLSRDPDFLSTLSSSMSHLIVDEVQDSSVIQWHILNLLSKNNVVLFLVGDPAQSIYGFRGADHQQFNGLTQRSKAFDVTELDRNFRSLPGIINLGNWFRRQIDPQYLLLEGIAPKSSPQQAIPHLAEFSEIMDMIKWLIEDATSQIVEGVSIKDIMILCRANELVKLIKARLKNRLKMAIPDETVTTIHRTKGLGIKMVWLIDPRFAKVPFDHHSEHQRLLYVGVTRAKSHLTICKSTCGRIPHLSPDNTYILDRIPDAMIKVVN